VKVLNQEQEVLVSRWHKTFILYRDRLQNLGVWNIRQVILQVCSPNNTLTTNKNMLRNSGQHLRFLWTI